MKNLYHFLIISLLFSFLMACASVDYSQQAEFPEAKADQALIYFYRSPGFVGSTYRFNLSEGDKVVGAMAQDSYFYLFTTAGEHTYAINDQYKEQGSSITMNVQTGNIYYVKVDIRYQIMGGKAIFNRVDQAEAMKVLPSRKYVVPSQNAAATYNVHAEQ